MAMNYGNDDEPIASINITPFVDIILVVLIIFMIATPVLMNPGIKVNLPQASSGDTTSPSQLNISIITGGEIFINGKKSSESEIEKLTKEALAKNPDAQAIIAADREVPHGKVISVLDKVKASGIKRFAISIEKK